MTSQVNNHLVATIEHLEALYGAPSWAALTKECDIIIPPYREFIAAAPYLMLATVGPEGVECSSRGGDPGFVRIRDANTLLIPDFGGNNRIESLRNIVRDPRIALHFLIPGCGETLRVKGRAVISVDGELLSLLGAKKPRVAIAVTVTQAYYHCAKAVMHARLWDESRQISRDRLPGVNAMLAAAQWRRCQKAITSRFQRSSEILAP